jgi:hypothetical protein
MTTFTEGRHAAEFVLSEAEGTRSRDNVTLHGGFTGADKLKPGTVLGKITSGGKYAASPRPAPTARRPRSPCCSAGPTSPTATSRPR